MYAGRLMHESYLYMCMEKKYGKLIEKIKWLIVFTLCFFFALVTLLTQTGSNLLTLPRECMEIII